MRYALSKAADGHLRIIAVKLQDCPYTDTQASVRAAIRALGEYSRPVEIGETGHMIIPLRINYPR